jgi:hypothetical protein
MSLGTTAMEPFFADFNKNKFNRIGYPLISVGLAADGILQLLHIAARRGVTMPIIEILYAILLVAFWIFPPKWFFKVDDAVIEYKGQLARRRHFDWNGVKGVRVMSNKVAISLTDGSVHKIALSFLGEKERAPIKDAVRKFAESKKLLEGN